MKIKLKCVKLIIRSCVGGTSLKSCLKFPHRGLCDLLDGLFMVSSINPRRKSHSQNATSQCNWLENDLKYSEITGA